MMTPERMERAVRSYFAAYLSADRAVIEAALHPDFSFTSPYDDHIDVPTYFERCWANAGQFEALTVAEVQGTGDHCFVLYEGRSRGGTALRNVERFTFRDERLYAVEVFFGLGPGEIPATPRAATDLPDEEDAA